MNKYEEAIKNINADVSGIPYFHDINTCTSINDIEALQELVERATPKKPIYDTDTDVNTCPNGSCENDWIYKDMDKFCNDCGQALDWSDNK